MVPLPPENKLAILLNGLDEAFLNIDQLQSEALQASALIDRLDQATLSKAFRGELASGDGALAAAE